jgi:hypothetical protein
MNNKVTNHPKHYFFNRMTRTSTGANRTPILGEFSMYTLKHIAEAMAELFDDPKWEGGYGRDDHCLGQFVGSSRE